MAASLPNPNMVFVPLDILTAEELNQMVANTNFLANLFPVASSNINWTGTIAPTSKNVLTLGTRKIMWGYGTVTNVPTGTDKTGTINFTEPFNVTPIVLVSPANWVASPTAIVSGATKTGFTAVVKHNQGSTQNITLNYIAIG